MAKLLDLSVYGPGHISNILQVDASVYAKAFVTDCGDDTQVVRGDGTLASISSLSVGDADTLDGYHESDFFIYRGPLYQKHNYDANTLGIGEYVFRSSDYGNVGTGANHVNALNENSTIQVFKYLQMSASAWSDNMSYRLSWGGETSTQRPNGWSPWITFVSSSNYTDYVNTINFPGLDKVGTVTSVTVTGANGLSGSGTITSSGTITLSNSGVRSVSINGNYLRVNTNGTNSDLTIPYATSAGNASTASKLNNALTLQANGTSLGTYDGSAAKTFNLTYANVGAAASSHTHTFASITSKPTTIAGYGITDAYTKTETDNKLNGYLPLSGGTMTGAINLSNIHAKLAFGSLATSPVTGYKAPSLQSNGVGIYSRYGGSSDEGAIIITEDTCVIYNSADTGWNFQVMDKDIGTDMTNDATRSFGVNQNHQAFSLGGFVKSGSSDDYILLGGGGHYSLSNVLHGNSYGTMEGVISDCNSVSVTGIYSSGGFGNRPDGVSNWGTLFNLRLYNSNNSYHRQLFFDCYASDKIWTRSDNEGTWTSWKELITSANIGSQSVNYANSAASATSSTQATNLTPENTAHYFRDPNNPAWRGGMIWGSAGNESMSFVVANSNTRFQFVGGSDIANWGSATWQSVNPYLTIYSSGIVTPGSATASGGFIKSGYDNTYVLLAGGGHKAVSDFSTSVHNHYRIKLSDDRSKYPGQLAGNEIMSTFGGFMQNSTLGISNFGYYSDVLVIRSYLDSTGGRDNAIIFNKNTRGVWHTQFEFGSTTSWGTPYLFLDSNNFNNYSPTLTGGGASGTWGINITGNAGYADSAGNADTLDAYHHTSFAKIADVNNLMHSGNEFTYAAPAYSGDIWHNYRTSSWSTDGNIVNYRFGNGAGGYATVVALAFYESSDERLKDFYNSIDVDLDKLSSLPKKFFKWKSNPNGEFEIGTSAQELQKIYPQLVNTDGNGYLTVAYDKLSIIALRAIDKLYEMNKNLERRIQILESKQ